MEPIRAGGGGESVTATTSSGRSSPPSQFKSLSNSSGWVFERHNEIGFAENFDAGLLGRLRDEEYESHSGSDNFDGGYGGDDMPQRKYHRHTPHQI